MISNTVCEHIEHSVFYKEQLGDRYERQGDYLIPLHYITRRKGAADWLIRAAALGLSETPKVVK